MEVSVQVNQAGAITSQGIIRHHEVTIDRPEAKGGTDLGPMGGELLLAALGGCFISNLLEAIRVREAPFNGVKIDITGTAEGSPTRFTAMRLEVSAAGGDREQLEKLVTIAERSCLVANTMKEAVALTIRVKSGERGTGSGR